MPGIVWRTTFFGALVWQSPAVMCAAGPAGPTETARPTATSTTAQVRAAALAQALEAVDTQLAAEPDNLVALRRRAALRTAAGQYDPALVDLDRWIRLAPESSDAYDERGSLHFIAGRIDASIGDFDRAIKLRPDREPWHWKRGISYYYAGRFAEGQKQFEGYQTVDDNDVENAVWRFLCMARGAGIEAARNQLLAIKRDARVPMMKVYALYAGRAQPGDVLEAARAGSPDAGDLNQRLFYAHLYLGLYYEVIGSMNLAREHLAAAQAHQIDHYMWHVARVHAGCLEPRGGR